MHIGFGLPRPCLAAAMLLVPFVACAPDAPPPDTAHETLAQIGAGTTLTAYVSDGRLNATLDLTNRSTPCPIVDAQATVNGAPMSVLSNGGGTSEVIGDGFGCGAPYSTVCNPVSFDAAFDPSATGDLNVVIQDSSGTYVFHSQIIAYTASFEPPYDGVLHGESWVNVAVSPAAVLMTLGGASFSVDFFADGDASVVPVFSLPFIASSECSVGGDGGGCLVRLTRTGVSFLVPSVARESGTLRIDGGPTSTTLECTGPESCLLVTSPSVVSLPTTVGP